MVRVVDLTTKKDFCFVVEGGLHWACLSPDGRSLVLLQAGDDGNDVLCYWDIPPRRPWWIVVGVPAAILALVLLVRMWRRGEGACAIGRLSLRKPIAMNTIPVAKLAWFVSGLL